MLLFGDQLTVARVIGAALLQDDNKTPLNCLEGFVPATADWHARMCLMQVLTLMLLIIYLKISIVLR